MTTAATSVLDDILDAMPAESNSPAPAAGLNGGGPDFSQRDITGVVTRIRKFDDFVILELDGDGARSAIGNIEEPADGDKSGAGTISAGVAYRFFGCWTVHSQYGPQFKFESFIVADRQNETGVKAFLIRGGAGLSISEATKAWRAYGADAIDVLRSDVPRVVADQVLAEVKAIDVSRMLHLAIEFAAVKIELFELFANLGFPRGVVDQCIKEWGHKAPAIVKRDPFRMMVAGFSGVGFKRADKLYLHLGGNPFRLKRQLLGAWYKMLTEGNGNTWDSVAVLEKAVLDITKSFADSEFERVLKLGLRAGWLMETTDPADGSRWLTIAERGRAEQKLAHHVKRVMKGKAFWPAIPEDSPLSPHQRGELGKLVAAPLGILAGSPGVGKAQPLDAKILTPTGWMSMVDMHIGQEIINSDGGISRVTGVFPQGYKDIVRIVFNDGTSTECCRDHLWLTQTRPERKKAQKTNKDLFATATAKSAQEIEDTLYSHDNHKNHYVPIVKPVLFKTRSLPIDPYLLGLLIGDGCFRSPAPTFSKPEPELHKYIRDSVPDGSLVVCDNESEGLLRFPGPVIKGILVSLGLWKCKSVTKFIPDIFKFADIQSRLSILQGLLDTDGCVNRGYDIEYSTSSERLACDVQFIVESLGGICRVSSRVPVYVYDGEKRHGSVSHRVKVKLPGEFAPFRLTRKASAYAGFSKYQPSRIIADIESVGEKPAQCIMVDSDDSLYVTDHCILTHNTFSAAAFLQQVMKLRVPVAVAAPTGKAAVRITEAMQEYKLPFTATTIHSLLGVADKRYSAGQRSGAFQFLHDEMNPLEIGVLVIDEASMCSTDLMADLFAAIPDGANVLIVGDPYQLPPVDHGAPLRDMIAANVPMALLTEIKRNSGAIVRACHQIKDGQRFETSEKINPDSGDNLKLLAADTIDEQISFVLGVVEHIGKMGFDPVWDCQILVATNDKSDISRVQLNQKLQPVLNKNEKVDAAQKFVRDDKVICLKNTWMHSVYKAKDASEEAVGNWRHYQNESIHSSDSVNNLRGKSPPTREVYIANGDVGKVLAANADAAIVSFLSPERIVKVITKKRKAENSDGEISGGDFDLAYAVTVHKAQGSAAPVVVVLLDPNAGMLCVREWLYTAISRASKLCFLVGKMETAMKAVGKVSLTKRKTFLRESLVS